MATPSYQPSSAPGEAAQYYAPQQSLERPGPPPPMNCLPQQYSGNSGPPPPPTNNAQPQENSGGNFRTTFKNRLQKPVAIPATMKKVGSPFLRAYPPALEQFAIPKDIFLRFLDDLNRVAVANPPLQVLGLAGNIVSFVPLATAQIVGTAVGAAATIGTYAVSKGRTEIFLKESNRDIFQPRGLKAEVAKLDALAQIAGMPVLDASGKVRKDAPVLQPIEDPALMNVSGQERRLQALEPWIAQLDLSPLPKIQEQTNPLSKWSKFASERQRKSQEKKLLKERGKAHEDYNKDSSKAIEDYNKEIEKLNEDTAKARQESDPKKAEKELRKVEEKRREVEQEYQKEMGKAGEDRQKDDKEEEQVRKILWLVIRDIDAEDGSGPNPYIENASSGGGRVDQGYDGRQ